MEEANNRFSARASNTALADGLLARRESALAGRERHLERTPGTKGTHRCLGSGDLPGQRGVPSSSKGPPDAPTHGSEDGASTPSHHERLMAGGAAAATILQPIFTGERRRVNTLASLGIVGDRVYLTPRIRPLDLRLQKMFPFQMKWIRVSFNLTSPLGSREFGMEASLESGAHAITGTEGTLTPKLPLTFLVSRMRVAVTSGAQQAVHGLGRDCTVDLLDADHD
ncbi:hypothetical protein TcBrA4_0091420 [Trypanosoma cruzi]|nr:hypothetical protein TcBrA4_0091420 [Trypanosoma cruzi]